MKKNIVMYFPLKNTNIPLKDPYQELLRAEKKQESLVNELANAGVEVYMARGEDSYKGNHIFKPQFHHKTHKWVESLESVEADLVLGFKLPTGITRKFNTMSPFTRDKTQFENVFPEYAIKSYISKNYHELGKNFNKISTQLKVLKPQFGTRSKGIFIGKSLPSEALIPPEYYPYLVQEFFDTSNGFYDFPGYHDFRIVMLNGKIIGKFLRQPEAGKYTANSFRRGNFINLSNWKIPKEILVIVTNIEAYCEKRFKHRYYSIDLAQGPIGEIKVFEMNSAPGLTTPELGMALGKYIAKNILKVS